MDMDDKLAASLADVICSCVELGIPKEELLSTVEKSYDAVKSVYGKLAIAMDQESKENEEK